MNTTVRLSALSFLLVPTIASAYLGGFEAGDGYQGMFSSVITSQNIGTDWQDGSGFVPAALGYSAGPPITYFRAGPDVIRYNAGTYGANNGGPGGVGIDIADNSGLWKANSGGAIVNDASNGTNNLNFITAHGGTAHSGSNFLAIRAIDATLNYDYSIDSRDLNGVAPNSIQSATYSMDFWFCPGQVISPGGTSANIFGLSYVDSMNTTGLKFGYNGQGGRAI